MNRIELVLYTLFTASKHQLIASFEPLVPIELVACLHLQASEAPTQVRKYTSALVGIAPILPEVN